jgi:hypothetical protein
MQTGLRCSSRQFCHCVLGWVDAVRRVRRAAADDLAVLDHTDNTRVDRSTRAIAVLSIATGLSALAPALRAGAQRLRALARCCRFSISAVVGSLSKTGPFVLDARLSQLDPSPTAQSQHIIGLLPKSQMWPGTPRTDGPNQIGMPSQTIQQPAGADWRI